MKTIAEQKTINILAKEELARICRGGREFTMCIPAQSTDSDLTLGGAIRDHYDLLDWAERAREELQRATLSVWIEEDVKNILQLLEELKP